MKMKKRIGEIIVLGFDWILCKVFGVHNKKEMSRIGVVRYCSICHRITKDGRKKAKTVEAN
jgi:hypothetical protein